MVYTYRGTHFLFLSLTLCFFSLFSKREIWKLETREGGKRWHEQRHALHKEQLNRPRSFKMGKKKKKKGHRTEMRKQFMLCRKWNTNRGFALLFLTHASMGSQCRSKKQIFGIKFPGKNHCLLCSHTHLYSTASHSGEQ